MTVRIRTDDRARDYVARIKTLEATVTAIDWEADPGDASAVAAAVVAGTRHATAASTSFDIDGYAFTYWFVDLALGVTPLNTIGVAISTDGSGNSVVVVPAGHYLLVLNGNIVTDLQSLTRYYGWQVLLTNEPTGIRQNPPPHPQRLAIGNNTIVWLPTNVCHLWFPIPGEIQVAVVEDTVGGAAYINSIEMRLTLLRIGDA